jgi:hypothetical protein
LLGSTTPLYRDGEHLADNAIETLSLRVADTRRPSILTVWMQNKEPSALYSINQRLEWSCGRLYLLAYFNSAPVAWFYSALDNFVAAFFCLAHLALTAAAILARLLGERLRFFLAGLPAAFTTPAGRPLFFAAGDEAPDNKMRACWNRAISASISAITVSMLIVAILPKAFYFAYPAAMESLSQKHRNESSSGAGRIAF